MDPKMKTALAVVVGVVIGVTLLGGAFAAHAVVGAVAFGGRMTNQGYGMMGQGQGFDDRQGMMGQRQGFDDRQGMMGQRGGQYGAPETYGACPNGEVGPDGTCPNTGGGMMGQRGGCQGGAQDGTGVCPNGETCPNITGDATTEL